VARNGLGLREHPKFTIVRLMGVVRPEVIDAGEQLALRRQIANAGEVWYLGFDELVKTLSDSTLDLQSAVAERVEQFKRDKGRRPPIAISAMVNLFTAGDREESPPMHCRVPHFVGVKKESPA
jgi:pyruvate,water dikinase